ncbi:MAG TPA: ADP-ribosylglycohydrolase family protein [Bacillota bacterium]|nr:ADP-ribosylglycohydrolase family protein [Bacillota bacterium]
MSDCRDSLLERMAGSLAGVAIGDAMGMPCEFLTRGQIREKYAWLNWFVAPDASHFHHGMRAGRITDDTEQTIALIGALDKHSRITPETAAEAYLKWADDCNAWQSTVMGPSTRRALERLKAGEDPRTTGSSGDTVGAAMRVAPIGLVNAGRLAEAAEECYMSCLPTHGVSIAIGGACAVACAVACAAVCSVGREVAGATTGVITGATTGATTCEQAATAVADTGVIGEILDAAVWGAEYGEARGAAWAGASVVARIRLARRIVAESRCAGEALDALYETCGVGMLPTELVPTAMGIVALYGADCAKAVEAAVNMGGDADTLASIVGAVTGALHGIGGFPTEWVRTVEDVNGISICELARRLVCVRERRSVHDRS